MNAIKKLLLALTLALFAAGAAKADPPHAWRMSETGTAPIAGTWTWNETTKSYSARWVNGAAAEIKMAKKQGDQFELVRTDSTGSSAGLTARYTGVRTGDVIKGTVEWTWQGGTSKGTWEARLAPADNYGPVLTPKQAGDIFAIMNSQTDISFRYPADGCYARAHIMAKRMRALGASPQKVWAFANPDLLFVQTSHSASGKVEWRYHVAPTLRVRYSDGDRDMVIDPSMFQGPATLGQWREAMRKPGTREAFLCQTAIGQAPVGPNGARYAGTGYWPGADPLEGLDANAKSEMVKDKPKQR